MGKTTLCKHYMHGFPKLETEDRTIVPILMAKIEVPASPKSLVLSNRSHLINNLSCLTFSAWQEKQNPLNSQPTNNAL
jgi:hypothetical protein